MRRPMPIVPVPHATVRVAPVVCPKGHRYPRLVETPDALLRDGAFVSLFPTDRQAVLPPRGLALVRSLPGAEGLSKPFGNLAVLLESGAQRYTTCHSGRYGGMALYIPCRVHTSRIGAFSHSPSAAAALQTFQGKALLGEP
jgi:hypothetical protein